MAWELWKETLLPGRYRDRHGNWFTYTRRHIAQAHRNVNRMLSRGVPLPCVWEHQNVEAGDPEEWKARYARNTFGHIAGSRINARGRLELLHRGPDERDRDQLIKTRGVSPKVYPGYSDSRGGEYRGTTIAHVAATPTPVQWDQKPFELSRGRALYLSYTPEGRSMADETETPAGEGKGGKPAMDADLKALIDALREKGLSISDKVQNLRELTIAVESCGGMGDAGDDEDDLGLDDDSAGTGDTTAAAGGGGVGGGGPMLMSDARAEPLRKMSRRDLENRAQRLFRTGRVAKPVATKLVREARSVELSFYAGGEPVPNALEAKIAAYEDLPQYSAWKPTGRDDSRELSTTEIEPPEQLRGKDNGGVDPKVLELQEKLARNLSVGTTK